MNDPIRPQSAESAQPGIGQVFFPASTSDVVEIVRRARVIGRPVFPLSTGMNWGYRFDLPVSRGYDVVDLRRMNRILNANKISESNPIAVIEPGVTQIQLYEFLENHAPSLMFNVTGSAAGTSIVGASLDRGVGYLGARREDLFGLEVVTGSGEVLRTGFRRLGEDSPLAHCHPYGLGPMLDGLFFQGNFGIVTSACFKLAPKQPCRIAVTLSLGDTTKLALFFDKLAALKRLGVIRSVPHVGNRARTHSTLAPGLARDFAQQWNFQGSRLEDEVKAALAIVAPSDWSAVVPISGTKYQVKAALIEVRRVLKGLARVNVVTDRRLDALTVFASRLKFIPAMRRLAAAMTALRPLHGLALGIPTDSPVIGLIQQFGSNNLQAVEFDKSNCGLIYICPAMPLDGSLISRVIEEMTRIAAQFNNILYATINIETSTSAIAVTNLMFDKRVPEEVARARRCAAALYEYIHGHKLEVYRAGDDMMPSVVSIDPHYWSMVRRLQSAWDPDGIIAPGHYSKM